MDLENILRGGCRQSNKGEDWPAGRGVRRRVRLGKDVCAFVHGRGIVRAVGNGRGSYPAARGGGGRRLGGGRYAAGRRARGRTGGRPAGGGSHRGERRVAGLQCGRRSGEPRATEFWRHAREREEWPRPAVVVARRESRVGDGRGSRWWRRRGGGRQVQCPLASRLTWSPSPARRTQLTGFVAPRVQGERGRQVASRTATGGSRRQGEGRLAA